MILLRFSFENEGSFLAFGNTIYWGLNLQDCWSSWQKYRRWLFLPQNTFKILDFFFFLFVCAFFVFVSFLQDLHFQGFLKLFYFILFIKEFSNKQFSTTFYSGVAFGHKKKSRWCGCNDITLNWDRKLIDHWMR